MDFPYYVFKENRGVTSAVVGYILTPPDLGTPISRGVRSFMKVSCDRAILITSGPSSEVDIGVNASGLRKYLRLPSASRFLHPNSLMLSALYARVKLCRSRVVVQFHFPGGSKEIYVFRQIN